MVKKKTCKVCGKFFKATNSLVIVCSPACAYESVKTKKAKKRIKKLVKDEQIESLKTKSDHLREAQTIFNKFIRERDKDEPCISCDSKYTELWDCGHYQGRKAHPALRFDEMNCSKQCRSCNSFLSGNLIEYRKRLVKKIGIKEVERLEGHNPPFKRSIDDIKAIKEKYKLKLKNLVFKNKL